MKKEPAESSQKYLTTSEMAEALRVHPATIRRWVLAGAPVLRLPGSLRFDIGAVRSWLETGRVVSDVE